MTLTEVVSIVCAIVAAGGAVIVGILGSRDKQMETITSGYGELVENLQRQVRVLQAENAKLWERVRQLETRIRQLTGGDAANVERSNHIDRSPSGQ